MTKNQLALKAYLETVTTGSTSKQAAAIHGVDRRIISYLYGISSICSEEEFTLVKDAIANDDFIHTTTGETTKSLECLLRILRTGARPTTSSANTPMILYLLRSGNYTKIGVAKSISNRIKMLQTGNPDIITLVYERKCANEQDARAIETLLHNKYKNKQVRAEWFLLSEEDIIQIINIVK